MADDSISLTGHDNRRKLMRKERWTAPNGAECMVLLPDELQVPSRKVAID